MPNRHALVIAVDGLRASALGAYGNAWHGTPALDALAAQSLVHDWMWCTSTELDGFYSSVWHGEQSLLQFLADAGVSASLNTDDPALADSEGPNFAEVCRLDVAVDELAPAIADTSLAQLFALAAQQLLAAGDTSAQQPDAVAPRLWWLHARGFHGPWDAPLDLRARLLDEEDPEPPSFLAPPHVSASADHDELLLCRVAYAAQVMALDECIGGLLAALAESGLDEDTLVVLVGCRGYALGEHGAVGAGNLYSESLHVPCLVRIPNMSSPPPRSANLAQPADLARALANWFGEESPPSESREFVVASGADGERAIRTPAWMLRQPPHYDASAAPPGAELYAKPDDRWEANEVANRCSDVAARLLSVLDSYQSATANSSPLPPLDRDLVGPAD